MVWLNLEASRETSPLRGGVHNELNEQEAFTPRFITTPQPAACGGMEEELCIIYKYNKKFI